MSLLLLLVASLIAYGYAHLVYPVNPLIVWGLLFFCWLCYRLRLRAVATFARQEQNSRSYRRRSDEQ